VTYGAALRGEWTLDADFLTVNHGSFGATPRRVIAAQQAWQARMEAQPTRFFVTEFPAALRAAAARLAAFLNARPDDLVFVENATTGCNAVLRSLRLQPGDAIVVLDHGYGAVVKAAHFAAERAGARVLEVAMPFPRADDALLLDRLAAALGQRVRLAVLDHITSPSAALLPVSAIVATCRAAGVPVLIDGAHGPGNADVDLTALDADWYVGNCHKWLMAPKGCGFLWARADRQTDLHPVTISHGFGAGFLPEFDWVGTRDPSAWLAVTAALDFHEHLGGAALRARNAALAAEAAAYLGRRLGTETGQNAGSGNAMAALRMPHTGYVDAAAALAIRSRLLAAGTDLPISAIDGQAWLRLSAQAYNELSDFERLADMLLSVRT
jgi:isopenicillin-N epimerase